MQNKRKFIFALRVFSLIFYYQVTQLQLSLNVEFHTGEWKPDVYYRIYKITLLDHILPTANSSRHILNLSLRFRLCFPKDSYLKFFYQKF